MIKMLTTNANFQVDEREHVEFYLVNEAERLYWQGLL